MRDQFYNPDLANHQASSDEGIPKAWGNDVARACTRWLHKRGLLASQTDPRLAAAQASATAARTHRRASAI